MSSNSELSAEARLRNVGNGFLEVGDISLRFYIEEGRFRKRRKIAREIQFSEIEGIEQKDNDLRIIQKDITDIFTMEQATKVDAICQKINASLTQRQKVEEKNVITERNKSELVQAIKKAIDTADSLFAILKNLHGTVDWKQTETAYRQSEENILRLANQGTNSVTLDIKPLSTALQEHRPREIAERTLDILRALYENFNKLSPPMEEEGQIHPNLSDAKLLVYADYLLNDLSLAAIVGDNTTGKESGELLRVVENIAKMPGSRIEMNAVKTSLDRFYIEKEKQPMIEEIRLMLQQQLEEPTTPAGIASTTSN